LLSRSLYFCLQSFEKLPDISQLFAKKAVSKNAEFDADFKSAEKVENNHVKKFLKDKVKE
jgi:hypothetical protein